MGLISSFCKKRSTKAKEIYIDKEVGRLEDSADFRLAIIVGHNKKSKGAKMANCDLYEYDYWSDVASLIQQKHGEGGIRVNTFYRDGIGIEGAYKLANKWCDKNGMIVELHFNAYNGQVSGCEVLYNDEYDDRGLREKEIANIFLKKGCFIMGNAFPSRGLKFRPKGERGWYSLSRSTEVPCILIEWFFGDNPIESEYAIRNKTIIANGIFEAAFEARDLIRK